ncbi:MAG: hypothetical protein AB7U29_21045 [Desulfobulbus sp.]
MTHEFESIGRRVLLLNARRLFEESGKSELILLAIEDSTNSRVQDRTDAGAGELPPQN